MKLTQRCSSLFLTAVLFVGTTVATYPHETPFVFTYLTELQPKGSWEFEQWVLPFVGQQSGDYANIFFRDEIEYGISDQFQLALYVNSRYVEAFRNLPNGFTGGPDVPATASPLGRFRNFDFDSVSLEMIYQLLNPYKDPIGLALYFEPLFGTDKAEAEPKLLLQKNFFNDRLVVAYNFVWEWEWEKELEGPPGIGPFEEHMAKEMAMIHFVGVSYQLGNGWWLGVEGEEHSEFEGFTLKGIEHAAFFLGPAVHYGAERWWASLSVLPQVFAVPLNEEQREVMSGGRIFGNEHVAVQVGLRVGISW
ncbi:DUF6662 family protein [Candidatus Methylacidithermus pantelleriae]|uniref:MetA-pathway of phenol degradation n=1 Tax=Candidatus Methylacidithermus pantelleriae TaxID=2744239 RepID=A0A8J2BS48_9BACT|nr:DUF6662 family protein [Candidatus Methylacidithermus pantelleriae]CAF0695888.1 conserved exported hypothetical protein [Candidatus Methylacidithermus pantelleriae]